MNLGAQAIIPMRPRPKPAIYPRKRGIPVVVTKQSKYLLPYFAHQQLDPAYFPQGNILPVRGIV